jgi:hypothetical protein
MGERRKDMDFPTLTVDAAGFQKIDISRCIVKFCLSRSLYISIDRKKSIILFFQQKKIDNIVFSAKNGLGFSGFSEDQIFCLWLRLSLCVA